MDEIHQRKLELYSNIEKIVRNFEQHEAETNERIEAIRQKSQSTSKSFGPANDLIRFLYILQQQYQSDDEPTRTKARESVLEYMNSYRTFNDSEEETDEEEEKEEETDAINDPQAPNPVVLPPESEPITPPQAQQPESTSSPPKVIPPSAPILTNEFGDITPETLARFQKLLSEAQKYEERYMTIDNTRKKALGSYIKAIMNKIRKETADELLQELFEFLNGQEKKILNQSIRVSNDDERLLCLSTLAVLILAQLLGGDLNDIKTEILLPLIGKVGESPNYKEFGVIFLVHLHKRCPYTVPYYPKRLPTMNDQQYYEALGYIKKQDGEQRRLETETEFLIRMNGLIRLFCKLLISRCPPFTSDLAFAWKWFADILNLPLRPNITSILIRVFLEEAGEVMVQAYTSTFVKIINTIRKKYLPVIEKETSVDQMARLRIKLERLPK